MQSCSGRIINNKGAPQARIRLHQLQIGRECTRDPDWQLVRCTICCNDVTGEASVPQLPHAQTELHAGVGQATSPDTPEGDPGHTRESATSSSTDLLSSNLRQEQQPQRRNSFNFNLNGFRTAAAAREATGQPAPDSRARSTLAVMTGADCIHLQAPPDLTMEEIELMGDLAAELHDSFALSFTCNSIIVSCPYPWSLFVNRCRLMWIAAADGSLQFSMLVLLVLHKHWRHRAARFHACNRILKYTLSPLLPAGCVLHRRYHHFCIALDSTGQVAAPLSLRCGGTKQASCLDADMKLERSNDTLYCCWHADRAALLAQT